MNQLINEIISRDEVYGDEDRFIGDVNGWSFIS
jgi:hypothetical protein